jgi:hypothetical protein
MLAGFAESERNMIARANHGSIAPQESAWRSLIGRVTFKPRSENSGRLALGSVYAKPGGGNENRSFSRM